MRVRQSFSEIVMGSGGDVRRFVAQHRLPIVAISDARVPDSFRLSNYVAYMSKRLTGMSRATMSVHK